MILSWCHLPASHADHPPFLVASFTGLPNPLWAERPPRERAAIMILARNREKFAMQNTMLQFQKAFNRVYNYPYVLLNDELFDAAFMRVVRRAAPHSDVFFPWQGLPREHSSNNHGWLVVLLYALLSAGAPP
jgi:hypothetical protein